MEKPYPPVHYAQYLRIAELVNLQHPKSTEYGKPAHDELLFIIVHQVYELWFKQILSEIDSVLELFSSSNIHERDMLKMVSRLQRVIEIQKLLLQQVDVLETMTPMDFLEFRDYLVPASGFQSFQFRLVENKLGLKIVLSLTIKIIKLSSIKKKNPSPSKPKRLPTYFLLWKSGSSEPRLFFLTLLIFGKFIKRRLMKCLPKTKKLSKPRRWMTKAKKPTGKCSVF